MSLGESLSVAADDLARANTALEELIERIEAETGFRSPRRTRRPDLRLVTDSRPDAGGHGKPTRHEGR